MRLPDWYILLILGLAAWRTWVLFARDDITRWIRWRVSPTVEEFLECPYCLGFWIGLGWWTAFQLWPHATPIVAVAVAVTALVPLIEHYTD